MREEDQWGSPDFCLLAHCGNPSTVPCLAAHADPITLPKCVEGTPQYLEDIIRLCRQEQPEQRPPAWKLLRLFSRTDKISNDMEGQDFGTRTSTGRLHGSRDKKLFMRLEDVHRMYPEQCLCDLYRQRSLTRYRYHCISCNQGNFDVCSQCFQRGAIASTPHIFSWKRILNIG
jgi:hypothetical protein